MKMLRDYILKRFGKVLLSVTTLAYLLAGSIAFGSDFAWQSMGPGPTLDGQVEGITGRPVVGAINNVLAHPTDANTLYVGATNGGLWKTTNALSASGPNWTPLSDFESSLSIGALEFDRSDSTSSTLVAGIGRYSSFSRMGGARTGLLKSTDSGQNWSAIDGGGTLYGLNISGVYANGQTMVVSVNTADSYSTSTVGIFRSTDGGTSFNQVSGGSGLSTGASYSLMADSNAPGVLYTSVALSEGQNGIFRSADSGASWSKVSSTAMDNLFEENTSNVALSVGNSNEVYATIINAGRPVGIFRSSDGTGVNAGAWVEMDLPETNEGSGDFGLNPKGFKGPVEGAPAEIAGGQGAIHFSMTADPTDPNRVYVGGDRQPIYDEGTESPSWPNSIGATDYTGRLFRGDASQSSGDQWANLTHDEVAEFPGGGTLSGSAPHADSRDMTFDANGNLIEVDDGGIYIRTNPSSNEGDWFSLNGDIRVTEFHDIAYDSLSNSIVGGAQDTGTPIQDVNGAAGGDEVPWYSISTADGGDVAVDNLSSPTTSTVYSSNQNLGLFQRNTYDASGALLETVYPALTPETGQDPMVPNFKTPIALNAVDPNRIAFGGTNGVYESADRGETIATALPGVGVGPANAFGDPIAYGGYQEGVPNADLLYFGSGVDFYSRTVMGHEPELVSSFDYLILDVAIDSGNWSNVFVSSYYGVFFSDDSGANFTDISGNLFGFGAYEFYSLAFIDLGLIDALVVGGFGGIFYTMLNNPGLWYDMSELLPNVTVFDLDYNLADDILVAGTLGRGAWSLDNVSSLIPEPAWSAAAFALAGLLVLCLRRRLRG